MRTLSLVLVSGIEPALRAVDVLALTHANSLFQLPQADTGVS